MKRSSHRLLLDGLRRRGVKTVEVVAAVEVPDPPAACAAAIGMRLRVDEALAASPLPHGPGCVCTYVAGGERRTTIVMGGDDS